jgi:hypothetical protein
MDTARTAPKQDDGLPKVVRTNVNAVSAKALSDQRATRVPAIFGITNDGLYAVAQHGFWEDILLDRRTTAPAEEAEILLRTPVSKLTLNQRVQLGLLTRTHALPSLYCQLESIHGEKELALIDSGSECNCLSIFAVQKYGLAIQETRTMSKGLYQSRAFLGETQAKVILAGQAVTCHFFVLDDTAGGYDLLLGMPFLKETSLTFDYSDGRLVTANVVMGNKLIKAHVVSDKTAKVTQGS